MPPLKETIPELSRQMLALDPGSLAQLRRMEVDGPGMPAYWRLATECGFLDSQPEIWMRVVKIMAILIPRGKRRPDDRLHDGKRRFGAVLCDGGDPDWAGRGGEVAPIFSETRLARFLTLSPSRRGEALERLARMLAARRNPASGLNCIELAALLISNPNAAPLQKIARDYYQRLDAHTRQEQK
ncbi:MAG: hypothetical protein U5J62_09685 [Desulfurivibrio sp.]|nr:hypothetical protein [Desulfurivibrio sp.]